MFKRLQDGNPYLVCRVQGKEQLTKVPVVTGTVVIVETLKEIWCVSSGDPGLKPGFCKWDGNSDDDQRWNKRVLRWDGMEIRWTSPSVISTRKGRQSWERINQLHGADIVDAIISGKDLKKPRSKPGELDDQIRNLELMIEEKDKALASVTEALKKTIEENHTLRSQLQSIIGTPANPTLPSRQLPSSLSLLGPTVHLGDRAYIPSHDGSEDQPVQEVSHYSQPLPMINGYNEQWIVDGLSEHYAITHSPSSSSVSSLLGTTFLRTEN